MTVHSIEILATGVASGLGASVASAWLMGVDIASAAGSITPEMLAQSAEPVSKWLVWVGIGAVVWVGKRMSDDVKKFVALPSREDIFSAIEEAVKKGAAHNEAVLTEVRGMREDFQGNIYGIEKRVRVLETDVVAIKMRHETEDRLAS